MLLHGLLQLLGFGLVSICSLLIWEMVVERMDKGVVVVLGLEKEGAGGGQSAGIVVVLLRSM